MSCYKCELLGELYEQVPKTPRDYWIMTEMFYLLHGSDVCDSSGIRHITAVCPVCGEAFAVIVDEDIEEGELLDDSRGN